MIETSRNWFNDRYSEDKYQDLLSIIRNRYNYQPAFRIAESPIFIPGGLKDQLLEACHEIMDVVCHSDFKNKSESAIVRPQDIVPNENPTTDFLQMDFGICRGESGELIPQLIELQGFPSVYFFQHILSQAYRQVFDLPHHLTTCFEGISTSERMEMLRDIILDGEDPNQVVLLEIEPEKQNTYIDFLAAEEILGIKILCLSKVIKRGKKIYYKSDDGKEIQIKRVFNRVIFDELEQRKDFVAGFSFQDELDITWAGHPNWFFRISKHTLPLLKNKYVPDSFFLDQLKEYPHDLENYVLKPLYSFSGQGIELNVDKKKLDSIRNKENYLLQKRVEYFPIIKGPDEPSKCEIRMLMLWPKGEDRAVMVTNLARLSKGAMIGVKYNKDRTWVGGSIGFYNENS